MNPRKKVLLAVGGSGGHLFPAQQLSCLLEGKADVLLAGHGLKKNSFLVQSFQVRDIAAAPFGRKTIFPFIYQSMKGFVEALFLLRKFAPDVVVGFGSYHTFPVLAAAAILRKKIVLFEANCILGKVNRLFLPYADQVAIQFSQKAHIPKATLVPILPWGLKERKIASKKEACSYFGLDPKKKTVLVFGGSQGAAFLNERLPRALAHLEEIQVIHFTGKGGRAVYGNAACVKEFEGRMDLAYAAADIVVCRAGAATIGELLTHAKPALLIPFPFAMDNHQLENAKFLAETVQGALLLEQSEATLEKILAALKTVFATFAEKEKALQNWKQEKRVDFADLVLF